jgi:hypothetical protein
MDTNKIKNLLMRTAESCASLAKRLSDKGAPLTADDRQLIRIACLPELELIMTEIKMDFLVAPDTDTLADCIENSGLYSLFNTQNIT